jgi:TonB family protein
MVNRSDLSARVVAILDANRMRGRIPVASGLVITAVAVCFVAGVSPLVAVNEAQVRAFEDRQVAQGSFGGSSSRGDGSTALFVLPQPRRRAVLTVTPRYPPEAEALEIHATVDLRLTVDAAGAVTDAEAISFSLWADQADSFAPNSTGRRGAVSTDLELIQEELMRLMFATSAVAAAKQWTFEPANAVTTVDASFAFRPKPLNMASTGLAPDARLQESPKERFGSTLAPVTGSAQPGLVPRPRRLRASTDGVRPPLKISHVSPVYSESALTARVQGAVVLEAVIGADGSVLEAHALRSIPELDQAAIDAVRQWRYEPPLSGGEPVELVISVTVTFQLP